MSITGASSPAGTSSSGSGYAATGVTITDTVSITGASSWAGTPFFGGGYAATRVTITDAGIMIVTGNVLVGGSASVTGASTLKGRRQLYAHPPEMGLCR